MDTIDNKNFKIWEESLKTTKTRVDERIDILYDMIEKLEYKINSLEDEISTLRKLNNVNL